jgi:hypothetical protein
MQNARRQQLDLLELTTNTIQRHRLDPIVRAQIVSLLKLPINERSAALAKAEGADDE